MIFRARNGDVARLFHEHGAGQAVITPLTEGHLTATIVADEQLALHHRAGLAERSAGSGGAVGACT